MGKTTANKQRAENVVAVEWKRLRGCQIISSIKSNRILSSHSAVDMCAIYMNKRSEEQHKKSSLSLRSLEVSLK